MPPASAEATLIAMRALAAWVLGLGCLLGATEARAKCMAGALSVWPQDELPANGQLALELYGEQQRLARALPERRPRLVAEADEVPLVVEAVYPGEYNLTAVVLVPSRTLRVGERYRLLIDGVPEEELSTWGEGGRSPITFRVTPADTEAPTWDEPPRLLRTRWVPMGCGPAIYAEVELAAKDQHALTYLVELEDEAGGVRRFPVRAWDGVLQIGHGMCSGGFVLHPGVRYRARITAVDTAGRSAPAPGEPLTFAGPAPTGPR